MARLRAPTASINAQVTAVRRAASSASMGCQHDGHRVRSALTKAELQRDNLVAAAMTLQAVRASREALDMMPAAQREKLSIDLAALGYIAVRAEQPTPSPEAIRG